ncbi:MAG TPA: dipeptidase [Thermohalobaculum sp.]|nr:dipeptidase [Thermohalobaculum sp.]
MPDLDLDPNLDPGLDPVLARLDADTDAALERLFALLRFQSISTDPAYAGACREAAEWLAHDLASIGFESRVAPTAGHPMVVARDHAADGPHVLFYGHYDVQPADPLELWERDPFDPAIVTRPDGSRFIAGRGASDDKGQLMTFVEACRAFRAVHGCLPCRVTILLEGEEETGGESLPPFLEENRDELTADLALICDTGMWDAATPAITTMLRGNFAEQVTIHAASRDLHSGMYGGAAANPIHVLTRILGALHDAEGRVTIPGFYDGVPEVSPELRAEWEKLEFSPERFLADIGLSVPAGERGHSLLELVWARPTAEVNGIWGGYTGAGFKTVIPAEAHAKVSFRLVGEQDPEAIRAAFRRFVRERLPADCRAEFRSRGGGPAIAMPLDSPAVQKARRALTDEWGTEAALVGCGGSIPVVAEFRERLGMDSLLIGFGLEDDRIHSPNEKYELASFTGGARSWARVLAALAA